MKSRRIELTPIHPFTPGQARVIIAAANGKHTTREAIANVLHRSPHTIKAHVRGLGGATEINIKKRSRNSLGILGIMEKITQDRPPHLRAAINRMMGDVLFFR